MGVEAVEGGNKHGVIVEIGVCVVVVGMEHDIGRGRDGTIIILVIRTVVGRRRGSCGGLGDKDGGIDGGGGEGGGGRRRPGDGLGMVVSASLVLIFAVAVDDDVPALPLALVCWP
jgi:hypothetical protein